MHTSRSNDLTREGSVRYRRAVYVLWSTDRFLDWPAPKLRDVIDGVIGDEELDRLFPIGVLN